MRKYVLTTLLALASSASANPLVVEAFYDKDTRLINVQQAERIANVSVFDLSAPEKLEDILSEGLSDVPEVAQRQAQERIANGGYQLQIQLQEAYEGSLKAMQYDIQKLPAVVFNNGLHKIYGVSDVHKAIAIYKEQVEQ